jgi:hypothetical protein
MQITTASISAFITHFFSENRIKDTSRRSLPGLGKGGARRAVHGGFESQRSERMTLTTGVSCGGPAEVARPGLLALSEEQGDASPRFNRARKPGA